MADSAPRYSSVILTAGGLSLTVLVVAGITRIDPPEWLAHLCTSIAVVAIVHLLDRYVFLGETRQEFGRLSSTIVEDVTGKTHAALDTLTTELTASVTDHNDELLAATETSLKEILMRQSESLKAMEDSGIRNVYASRGAASGAIAEALRQKETTEIRILGISLNDFCRGDQDLLHRVWQDVKRRVGESAGGDGGSPLRIRMMLIDPECSGATLRSYAESRNRQTEWGRLETDVREAAKALRALEMISKDGNGASFECRVYRIGPTFFLCHTNATCFVQQYHFWTERLHNTPIPVLEYQANPGGDSYRMHDQVRQHFELIWEQGSVSLADFLENASVGIDSGAGQLGLVNIITNRQEGANRMLRLLEGAKQKVLIQGVSLKSFFAGTSAPLVSQVFDLVSKAEVVVQILILDPECEQAVYRSYRERLLQPQGRNTAFEAYRQSPQHESSKLVTDTRDSLEAINYLIDEIDHLSPQWKGKLDVRLYSSAPSCFMLVVDDRVLVEPYNYGKIGVRREGIAAPITLGTDMPLFEYQERPSQLHARAADPLRNPYGLLLNHFQFVFEHAKVHPLRTQPGAAMA